jgi:hypothetical protein
MGRQRCGELILARPDCPPGASSQALLNSGASADVYSIAELAAIVKFHLVTNKKAHEIEGYERISSVE